MVISAFHDGKVYEIALVALHGKVCLPSGDEAIAKTADPGRVE